MYLLTGAASVSKALSTYTDALFDYKIRAFFLEHVPMDLNGLAEYADFFSLTVTMVFASRFYFYLLKI